MSDATGKRPQKQTNTQGSLQSAVLIRILRDGRHQYYIFEDVATRQRRRFDTTEALLANLRELFDL